VKLPVRDIRDSSAGDGLIKDALVIDPLFLLQESVNNPVWGDKERVGVSVKFKVFPPDAPVIGLDNLPVIDAVEDNVCIP